MPLHGLLNEIIKKKARGGKIKLLSDEDGCIGKRYRKKITKPKKVLAKRNRVLVAYESGEGFGSAYFTKREADCMVLLLKGKTINGVADALKLSPRTVEYYVKNMKAKLGCRTKFELIEMVHASDFLDNIGF